MHHQHTVIRNIHSFSDSLETLELDLRFGRVREGPGGSWDPKERKSQPEVSEMYRKLLECHFLT